MRARRWLENQLRRAERANLDTALLTQRGVRYVASRLSWLGARSLLRTGQHILEYLVLSEDMPFQFLAPLFAIRALPALLTGLHWGALETLRAQVRREVASRRGGRARIQVEAWLAWTGLFGAAGLGAVVMFIFAQPDEEAGPLGL
jgi:hypothetical protein